MNMELVNIVTSGWQEFIFLMLIVMWCVQVIDPVVPRYTALSDVIPVHVVGATEEMKQVQKHPKVSVQTHSIQTGIFLDPEGRSQKATQVVVLVVISSNFKDPKIPKAFLICSRAQQNFVHIRADIAHRSTVSDFSLIY